MLVRNDRQDIASISVTGLTISRLHLHIDHLLHLLRLLFLRRRRRRSRSRSSHTLLTVFTCYTDEPISLIIISQIEHRRAFTRKHGTPMYVYAYLSIFIYSKVWGVQCDFQQQQQQQEDTHHPLTQIMDLVLVLCFAQVGWSE